jgi:hypothetical protein
MIIEIGFSRIQGLIEIISHIFKKWLIGLLTTFPTFLLLLLGSFPSLVSW